MFIAVLDRLNIGGEGGIRTIDCGALYGLASPCSDTRNKALIGISISARFYRRVLKANSDEKCSTAMKNVARNRGTR